MTATASAVSSRSRRFLIVSASMGAGHDAAARELARRFELRGAETRVVDLLSLPRLGQGRALRGFYRQLVGRAPAAFDFFMRSWAAHPAFYERLTATGGGAYQRPLLDLVGGWRPDVVVSTYNLAAQLLGRLRLAGGLSVPVVSYVTDPGAHRYWVAAGADRHLAPLRATADALRTLGAADVRTVAPVVAPRFLAPPAPDEVRRQVGDQAISRTVLVNAGSWGVGAAVRTVRALSGNDALSACVLTGRSARLAHRVQRAGGSAIGWTDQLERIIAGCDVVVDNAGGMTAWETLAVGRPLVLHRPIAGHGRLNAAALRAAGLAVMTTTPGELRAAAAAAVPVDATWVFEAPDAAELVLELA